MNFYLLFITSVEIKENLHEKLGIIKYTFLPLLSYPTELIEDLAFYINYLFHKLPTEVLQKYKGNAGQGLLHFIQECLYRQPRAIKKFLKALLRCEEVLIPRYHLLHSTYNNMEDKWKNPDCEMHIDLDFVPSILVEDWPRIAREWVGNQMPHLARNVRCKRLCFRWLRHCTKTIYWSREKRTFKLEMVLF